MISLAIDTSSHLCAVAIYDDSNDAVLCQISEDIGRGHAERLMDVIGKCLKDASLDFSDIQKVVSTVGPGSFTGVRVGLATARGIALGLSIPIVGVSTLDALEGEARFLKPNGSLVTMLDAKRDEAYVQWSVAEERLADAPPLMVRYDQMSAMLTDKSIAICGSGVTEFQKRHTIGHEVIHALAAAPISMIARLGASMEIQSVRPEPLYLRAPDAKPQPGLNIIRKA